MEIHEYLFTGFVIIAILIGSTTMMTMLSEPHRGISEREQLKVAAQKIMKQLMLDPGNPPDWGSNITITANELNSFGLAKYSETTRDAYVLDPNKVLRLNRSTILTKLGLFISPSKVVELLNLESEYGFSLEMRLALNVTLHDVAPNESDTENYNVTVQSLSNTPIAGAIVTSRMYLYKSNKGFTYLEPLEGPKVTDINGNCTLSFNVTSDNGTSGSTRKGVFLIVDYLGVRVVKMFFIKKEQGKPLIFEQPRILLGNLILAEEELDDDEGVIEILLERGDKGLDIINVAHNLTIIDNVYNIYKLDFLEPSLVAVLAASRSGELYCAYLDVDGLTYSTVEGIGPIPFSYPLERSVSVGGSTYILRLYVWRMSW